MSLPYLADVARLWQEGYDLTGIGQELGFSREWARCLRLAHPLLFGERPWASAREVGRVLEVSGALILRWATADAVRTSPRGLIHVGDAKEMHTALLERQCEYPGCENRIGRVSISDRFCLDHSAETRRYHYPVKTAEAKRRYRDATQRWKDKHPDRVREMSQRAGRAYRQRQRERAS